MRIITLFEFWTFGDELKEILRFSFAYLKKYSL